MCSILVIKIIFFIVVPMIYSLKNEIIDDKLNHLHQTNTELFEVIKEKYLVPPPCEEVEYNFSKKQPNINGQVEQPIMINEKIFENKIKNGFFIEAGAYDGEVISNTLFFELKQSWTGLLIEPNPDAFEELSKKNRKAWLFGQCLSTKLTPEIVDFDASGPFGGIINEGQKPGIDLDRFEFDFQKNYPFERRTIKVQCFPLYSILIALGNPTVHYLSLDVEGSEFQILKTIPFDKVDIKVIDVEINHVGDIFPGTLEDIMNYLDVQGYEFHFEIGGLDAVFIKKGFLNEINEL